MGRGGGLKKMTTRYEVFQASFISAERRVAMLT